MEMRRNFSEIVWSKKDSQNEKSIQEPLEAIKEVEEIEEKK
jgi:hypothetical protein